MNIPFQHRWSVAAQAVIGRGSRQSEPCGDAHRHADHEQNHRKTTNSTISWRASLAQAKACGYMQFERFSQNDATGELCCFVLFLVMFLALHRHADLLQKFLAFLLHQVGEVGRGWPSGRLSVMAVGLSKLWPLWR